MMKKFAGVKSAISLQIFIENFTLSKPVKTGVNLAQTGLPPDAPHHRPPHRHPNRNAVIGGSTAPPRRHRELRRYHTLPPRRFPHRQERHQDVTNRTLRSRQIAVFSPKLLLETFR
jgi:hypothetical protein